MEMHDFVMSKERETSEEKINYETDKVFVKHFQEDLRMVQMGIPDFMVSLAYKYEYGNGTKRNIKEAIKWYKKAGDSESKERAKNLQKELND